MEEASMLTEREKTVAAAGQTALEKIVGYQFPPDAKSARDDLMNFAAQVESQRAQGVSIAEKEARRAKKELERQWGITEVAEPFFEGLGGIEETLQRLARKSKDKLSGRETVKYELQTPEEVTKGKQGRFVDEVEARQVIVKGVLGQQIAVVSDMARKLKQKKASGERLDREEKGQYYAAQMILEARPVVYCELVETASQIEGAMKRLENKKDDLEGLDSSQAEETLAKLRQSLPKAKDLKVLAKYQDVTQGLRRRSTTYVGARVAEAVSRITEKVVGRRPTTAELSVGFDLEKEAKKRIEESLIKRGERMYQDETLDYRTFDQAAETMAGRASNKKEADQWRRLARARYYFRESVPVFFNDADAFLNARPALEQAKTKGEPWVLPEEDMYALLNDEKVRRAAVRYYRPMKAGDIVFGDKGRLYEMRPDGEAVKPIGQLPLHERLALEMLHSWGVHPDPFKEKHGPQRKPVAWHGTYKAIHDSFRRLYPYDKWARAGELKLFRAAIGMEDFTLIMEDPEKPGEYFLGDHLQMRGLTSQDLLTRWDEIKTKRDLRSSGWFWSQIRKGVETANGWGDLFAEGILTPKSVWEKLGQDKYAHIPAGKSHIRDQILRRIYRQADEAVIRGLLVEAATKGILDKTALYNAVMLTGLKMTDLFEMTGIYFTAFSAKGGVEEQIEAMKKGYLADPDHAGASDEEVRVYILEKTGLDLTAEIPETYHLWRKAAGQNLLEFEGFKGTIDELLAKIREKGIDKYRFKGDKSKKLAELLLEDPVHQILGKLLETVQDKNWADFQDWISEQRDAARTGQRISEMERMKEVAKLKELRANGVFKDLQLEKALKMIDGLPKAESRIARLKTIDGLIHERWPTPTTASIAFMMEIVEKLSLGAWKRETSSAYEWCQKWLGANPFAAVAGTASWLGLMGTEWLIAGAAPPLLMWTGSWFLFTLAGSAVTDALHLLNEYVIRFTREPYDLYLFRPRKKG